jgi:8-oxo-dGTP pyrophosphatase MutT (NUDIX family)
MSKPTIIAAGGLVTNDEGQLLMIFRRGKWDLPKGKLDEGESIEACAVREVTEETGVDNIVLGGLLGKTYHEYFDKWQNADVIKETWWYSMQVKGTPALIPQTEEDIENIEWCSREKVKVYLHNSYDNIITIVQQAGWL